MGEVTGKEVQLAGQVQVEMEVEVDVHTFSSMDKLHQVHLLSHLRSLISISATLLTETQRKMAMAVISSHAFNEKQGELELVIG
ncbi:hypothetical protein F2Q70_00035568 [Brassica cretica]|uniref:Uncharacterized protein n=1 Tax=Brassica cretica TaxID=69181 RepID=A0A8S9JUW8_BRACR|nr:hypothetical protein F2Q70_00035568 [Brassica cretica]